MSLFSNLNDGTQNAPRLQCGQTLWGMIGLPMNAATSWTLDEKFARCRDANFQHVECFIRDDDAGRNVLAELKKHDLQWSLGHRPMNVADTRTAVEFAVNNGARWVLCQPASAFHSLEEVVEIVHTGCDVAAANGLPYFVETHRNNFTENIPQTLQLIEAIPEIKMTADFSHFVVVGEFYGWKAEGALERMQPIINRIAHVHGRISNGEAVQVDVGDGEGDEGTPAHFFTRLWAAMFQSWRQTAQPGDVMPFSSELGPPRYAITLPDGSEFSDRWEQGLVMRKLAERAWAISDRYSSA